MNGKDTFPPVVQSLSVAALQAHAILPVSPNHPDLKAITMVGLHAWNTVLPLFTWHLF